VLSPLRYLGTLTGHDLLEVSASTDESGVKFRLTFRVGTVADSVLEQEVLQFVRENVFE